MNLCYVLPMAGPCVFARERGQRADVPLRRILIELLDAVRKHFEGVLLDEDIEALHDFRVGVRRSRVAAALLAKTTKKMEIAVYRNDLKWLGLVTGECRDLDVVCDELKELNECDARVRSMLVEDRLFAHRKVLDALRSRRFESWAREWEIYLRQAPGRSKAPLVEDLARLRINKARQRVLNAAGVEVIDASGLHRIRIACKRLRYDLEFFREIYEPECAVESIDRLKSLQNVLGAHHDAHVQGLRFSEMQSRDGVGDTVKMALRNLCLLLIQYEEKWKAESIAALASISVGR